MDTQRIAALKSGDYQVFAEVFECFWDKVYLYLVKKTHSPEAAKDLTQMVFIKLWRYRSSLSTDYTLNEQLFRKTKQVFIDWLRQETRRRQFLAGDVSITDLTLAGTAHEGIAISKDVVNAIQTLPPKRKEIFELRHIYGYSYKEIAELLGISTKTVDNQLLKANVQLRKLLQTAIYTAVINEILHHVN